MIISGEEGQVKQINIRSTEIETFKKSSIIIPNATLLSSSVTNLTHTNNWSRQSITIGVAYGSDIKKVTEILLDIAAKNKYVLKNPAPYVLFKDFGSNSLDFELRCYTNNIWNGWRIPSDIRYEINERFIEEGIEIPVKHICNSAAIMEYEDHRYDMARAGIILYGMYPSDEVDFSNLDLTPAMSWYSHVVNIMEPEMERGVSYGATYIVEHPCRLATVSVGYADGYARSLSNKGWVLIHGQKAPIVGRVCMDQMMVDITDITDVKLEDTVTLIGKDGDNYISVEDMANLAGSFNYEFVCDVGKRVPRVYKR